MLDTPLLQVEGISKKFCRSLKRSLSYGMEDLGRELLLMPPRDRLRAKEFWALDDVSFELRRGQCLGLVGGNGAGKSTLLKIISRIIRPDRGRVVQRGRVGALIELGAGFNPVLTGRENIFVNAAILGMSRRETLNRLEEIVAFAELREFIDAPVQSYSSGMKVRLGFAIAAQLLKPDVLIIDEVLAVGDAGFRAKCYDAVGQMTRDSAVVLVSHNMSHIRRMCDRVLWLDRGRAQLFEDTGEGVAAYLDSMPDRGLGHRTDPHATFTDVRIDGNAQATEPLDISFTLRLHEPRPAVRLYVTVLSSSHEPVAYSRYDAQLSGTGRDHRMSLRIDALPLAGGRYSLSLNAHSPDGRVLLAWHQGVCPFDVQGPADYRAGALLPARWQINAEGTAAHG